MYTYKGNDYDILKNLIKVKHPDTGEWFDAVLYISDKKDDPPFARKKEDFYQKFKFDSKVPYHVQMMAKFYGLMKDDKNVATGEIKRFNPEGKLPFKRGQKLSSSEYIDGDNYVAIWVHITHNWFKQIGLWQAECWQY